MNISSISPRFGAFFLLEGTQDEHQHAEQTIKTWAQKTYPQSTQLHQSLAEDPAERNQKAAELNLEHLIEDKNRYLVLHVTGKKDIARFNKVMQAAQSPNLTANAKLMAVTLFFSRLIGTSVSAKTVDEKKLNELRLPQTLRKERSNSFVRSGLCFIAAIAGTFIAGPLAWVLAIPGVLLAIKGYKTQQKLTPLVNQLMEENLNKTMDWFLKLAPDNVVKQPGGKQSHSGH